MTLFYPIESLPDRCAFFSGLLVEIRGDVSKQGFVQSLKKLPSLVAASFSNEEEGFLYLPDSSRREQAKKKYLKLAKNQYLAHSAWLEFDWLDRLEILSEIRLRDWMPFKIFAERTMAFERLAKEIFVWLEKNGYPLELKWIQSSKISPLLWTLHNEIHYCYEAFLNNGYGKSPPIRFNKRKSEKFEHRYYDSLAIGRIEVCKYVLPQPMNPLDALESVGRLISTLDPTGFESTYFTDYCRSMKRFFTKLRKSPLKTFYLEGDSVKLSEQHKRGKSNKGFAKNC